jgi:hypothetical protein
MISDPKGELLRHAVATIAFRGGIAVTEGAPIRPESYFTAEIVPGTF